ncbi:hypothetical protein BDQ17DRAFT_1438511 [Cyathus striatus]|nr:hypothetical protein BDQ17DRAFT_1438511 [Cyathus striatus]
MSSTNNLQVSNRNSCYELAPFAPSNNEELQVFISILSPIFSPLCKDEIMESRNKDGVFYTIDELKALGLWSSLRTLAHYVLRAAYQVGLEFPGFILAEEFCSKNPLTRFCPSAKLCYNFYADLKSAGRKAIHWIQSARSRSLCNGADSFWDWSDDLELDSYPFAPTSNPSHPDFQHDSANQIDSNTLKENQGAITWFKHSTGGPTCNLWKRCSRCYSEITSVQQAFSKDRKKKRAARCKATGKDAVMTNLSQG